MWIDGNETLIKHCAAEKTGQTSYYSVQAVAVRPPETHKNTTYATVTPFPT
jgi:hypothetical protein